MGLQNGSETAPPAGSVTLTVKPVAANWQPMNLRSLRLVPADK